MIPRGSGTGRFDWSFEYQEEDHDEGEKTFLGHTGNFNGEDIIDIVCAHPATGRFIARHLYNFFVADEPQVPAWSVEPPRNEEAVQLLADTFRESNYDMKSVLRVLFNSEFFKEARFEKIKSPVEVVVGTMRLVGGYEFPKPGIGNLAKEPGYMGQDLLGPPSVEGWHTGSEWINSGTLMKRINFTADMVGDTGKPGIQDIIYRIKSKGNLDVNAFVDTCLDILGPVEVQEETKGQLVGHASELGDLTWSDDKISSDRIAEMLQLIVATREYQYQ